MVDGLVHELGVEDDLHLDELHEAFPLHAEDVLHVLVVQVRVLGLDVKLAEHVLELHHSHQVILVRQVVEDLHRYLEFVHSLAEDHSADQVAQFEKLAFKLEVVLEVIVFQFLDAPFALFNRSEFDIFYHVIWAMFLPEVLNCLSYISM